MRGNKKYLVFGICVAFVLFSAFAGVATGHLAGQDWIGATQSSRPQMVDISSLAKHTLPVLATAMSG